MEFVSLCILSRVLLMVLAFCEARVVRVFTIFNSFVMDGMFVVVSDSVVWFVFSCVFCILIFNFCMSVVMFDILFVMVFSRAFTVFVVVVAFFVVFILICVLSLNKFIVILFVVDVCSVFSVVKWLSVVVCIVFDVCNFFRSAFVAFFSVFIFRFVVSCFVFVSFNFSVLIFDCVVFEVMIVVFVLVFIECVFSVFSFVRVVSASRSWRRSTYVIFLNVFCMYGCMFC